MSPFRPKGRKTWRVYLPTRLGTFVTCATGTHHRPTAVAMGRMVRELGPRGLREWDLLEAVTTRRLTLGALYDAYRDNVLDALRGRLADIDLAPHYTTWLTWIAENRAPATLEAYRARLRHLVPDATWPRSTLTLARVQGWLTAVPGTAANKQGHLIALQSFLAYLRDAHLLTHDPLDGLRRPRAKKRPIVFLELLDVQRVVDATHGRYRVLFALLHATAIEISPALKLTRRHFDFAHRALRMPGKKNATRDRSGIVAEWAWPIMEAHLRDLLPDAPLFGGLTRTKAGEEWRRVTRRLGLRRDVSGRGGVTMHDARHHWAVRMLRAGTPIEIVSGQLGHASAKMTLDVYGRFVPDYAELREWETRAGEMDERRATAATTMHEVG